MKNCIRTEGTCTAIICFYCKNKSVNLVLVQGVPAGSERETGTVRNRQPGIGSHTRESGAFLCQALSHCAPESASAGWMSRKQVVSALLPARPARTCPSGRCQGAGVHAVCAEQRRHNRHGLWDGQGPSRTVLIKSAEGVPGNIAPSPAMRRTGKQTFPEGRGSCPVRQNRQGRHQGEQGKKGLCRTPAPGQGMENGKKKGSDTRARRSCSPKKRHSSFALAANFLISQDS